MQNFFSRGNHNFNYEKNFFLFLIFYIAASLPKIPIIIFIFFLFFLIKKKFNIISLFKKANLIYYLPSIYFFLFIFEPTFYEGLTINNIINLFWPASIFIINIFIIYYYKKKDLNLKIIINLITLALITQMIIIFISNFFLFDYPITRLGFIDPFTNFDNKYLFFQLEKIKSINPVNIANFYEILEPIIVISLASISLNNYKKYYFFLFFFSFIVGCSFGSRLFVIFVTLIIFLNIFFFYKKKVLYLIFLISILIFFLNITIYKFVKPEKYITSFYDKKYDIKFDLDYSFEIQTFNEFLSFFDKYQPNKIYEQDNFYFFNITKESIYNYESFKIKKDYNLENYFAIKNINIKNINYKNTFQLRPASAFSTSFERFFNENEQKNIFYIFELQKWGVYNFSEDIMYANEGSHKDKNKHQIEHIIPGDYIIYHNIFLDNFNNKKYLASLCLFIIYIVIMKSFFCFRQSINENRLFFIFSIIIYFIYNQIIHTSFLTEKSFYYLFTIFYIFLILKKKEIIKKQ